MTSGPLRRRIEKLEARPVSPADVRDGLRLFKESGRLPGAPRVAGLVRDISTAVEAMRGTVPTVPPPGYVPPERTLPGPSAPPPVVSARPVPRLCLACGSLIERSACPKGCPPEG